MPNDIVQFCTKMAEQVIAAWGYPDEEFELSAAAPTSNRHKEWTCFVQINSKHIYINMKVEWIDGDSKPSDLSILTWR